MVAFGGGIISFLSPCVLPLVPAYLSVITGIDVSEFRSGRTSLARGTGTARIARTTFFFIMGFSLVFIVLGLVATSVGRALFADRVIVTRVSGVILIAMGVFLLAPEFWGLSLFAREKRFNPRLTSLGPYAAPVAGMAFAFGWTPCIGPILSSVLSVAAVQGQELRGGMLLAAYSMGLGVPFLIAGFGFAKLEGTFGWIKRHFSVVTAISAALLIFFGVLLAMNRFIILTEQLSNVMNFFDLGKLITLG